MVEGGSDAGEMQRSKIRRFGQHAAAFFCNTRDKLHDSWRQTGLMQRFKPAATVTVVLKSQREAHDKKV